MIDKLNLFMVTGFKVSEFVAFTAEQQIIARGFIQHAYPAAASSANKPKSATAKPARRGGHGDRLAQTYYLGFELYLDKFGFDRSHQFVDADLLALFDQFSHKISEIVWLK
jgi:hypothetical protein